jgi:hypothetical protein
VTLNTAIGTKSLENCLVTGLALILFREVCDMEKNFVNIINITA